MHETEKTLAEVIRQVAGDFPALSRLSLVGVASPQSPTPFHRAKAKKKINLRLDRLEIARFATEIDVVE